MTFALSWTVGSVDAAPSCTAACVSRMAACRAERCPDASGNQRRECRDVCRAVTGCAAGAARVRTIATIVNECRSEGGMWTGRQRLEIRRGDCPAVTVLTVDANQPAPDPLNVCAAYGRARTGTVAQPVGAFEGLAVSPDGDTVLFQVTDDFVGLKVGDVTIASPAFTPPVEGILVVHSDGSELRWLARQSLEPSFSLSLRSDGPLPIAIATKTSNGFSFSPDGTSVVLGDRGPGADGLDAPQVFTLDPNTGDRVQLTKFNASDVEPDTGFALDAWFLDDEHIGGFVFNRETKRRRVFRMRRDGSDFQSFEFHPPVAGATVDPEFQITGFLSDVFELLLNRTTDEPVFGAVREIFVQSGRDKLLQLTALGRTDTMFPVRLRDRQHVMFVASGNPLKKRNPSFTCQLFSIDVLGAHLRQLTRFASDVPPTRGCKSFTDGCTLSDLLTVQDQMTGSIVFDSSCAVLGASTVSQQMYAIRPDGSGFPRLSDYRGMTIDAGGAVSVELPGPVVYQAPLS